jgi:hypothetical protein
LGLALATSLPLRPCEGGVLELSGVFAGRFNFSRSAAFSARNFVLSARSAAYQLPMWPTATPLS